MGLSVPSFIQFGFSELWIDRVRRNISTLSISMGVDVDSSSLQEGSSKEISYLHLFCVGAKLLSRLGDNLIFNGFIPYSFVKKDLLSLLSYADDTILFTSDDSNSLKMMIDSLGAYEICSGQLVNKQKSCFILPPRCTLETFTKVYKTTGFNRSDILCSFWDVYFCGG